MYWDNSEYYGLGAGASGYIDGMRYRNRGPIQHYLKSIREKAIPACMKNSSARPSRWKKRCFRVTEKTGVSIERFEEKFGLSFEDRYGQVVRDLKNEGLLQEEDRWLRMTKRDYFRRYGCRAFYYRRLERSTLWD